MSEYTHCHTCGAELVERDREDGSAVFKDIEHDDVPVFYHQCGANTIGVMEIQCIRKV